MDRPILHPFVRELRESERLRSYAAAFPAAAGVSDPALPLVLAALHEELDRGLVALLPEDADARDAAEAAGWFVGDERVALFPSRGVHWGSGLEPPPHLVGERARALDVLARGGLVCASAAAVAEPLPPPTARPEPIELTPAAEVSLEALTEALALARAAALDPLPSGQPFAFEAQRPALVARGLAEAENELAAFVRAGNRVVVAFPHRGEALRQQNLLRRVDARILEDGEELPREAELLFAISPARRGFVWRDLGLVLLPDTQVFRKRPPRERRLGARSLQSFADLRTGDYVVHEDHGIGKLLSFETKEVAGVTRDYLLLAFRGDDRLYVPHEQVGKVSRYIRADPTAPALSKLGGKAWDNLKTRARESVRELAGELLALYAQRQQAPGVAYELRNEWLERLEAEFPYRETADQQTAIEAVKEDLEAPRPMDRLVCGDVGFGKTEVAN